MTTVILRNSYSEITIQVDRDELSVEDMFDNLIKPMLFAAGYSEASITEYFEI